MYWFNLILAKQYNAFKNAARLMSSIRRVRDKFDHLIFMEDQKSVPIPGGGLWQQIRSAAENARKTILPELVIMDSHLKIFAKYRDLQRR